MIIFQATSRRASCLADDPITTGSVGIPVNFAFSEHWDGLSKVVVFRGSGHSVDVLLSGDSCTVPPEVLTNPGDSLQIGVYGTDSAGNIVIPTVYADAGRILRGTEPSGIEPTPQTQPLINQLLAAATEAQTIAQSVRDDADAGEFDGRDGNDGTLIWWTERPITQTGSGSGITHTQFLHGEENVREAAPGDYVFGQDLGLSDSPKNTLYQILNITNLTIAHLSKVVNLSGPTGDDGISPTVTVEEIPEGHRVTITDADGDHVFDVMDGESGGGGSSDYDDLSNKPQIAGTTLSGNKSLANLGIQPERFVITLRWNYEGEIYLYADKTYSEILAAVNAGVKDIVVHWIEADTSQMDAWCWFDCVSGGEIFFHAIEYGDGAKSIHFAYVNSQNVWGGGDNVLGTYSKPSGGIPGSDLAETYLTHHQSLTDYRTAAAQDVIDQQIAAAIPSKTSDLQNDSGFLTQHQDISGKADKVQEITVSGSGAVTQALDAGKAYHFTGALTALTLTLNAPAGGQRAQYHFDFATGSTAPTVTIPGTVTMPTGWAVEANKRYEIDILDGFGVAQSWEVSSS